MKAIAMKATQQDWDSVKDLVKNNCVFDFIHNPYLVVDEKKLVFNCYKPNKYYKFYEKFDRAIFLDALDIVEEKIFDGFELQFRDKDNGEWFNCSGLREYRLKPISPEVKQLQELADKLGYKIEKK